MSKPKTTIAEQLNAAQLAINNSLADEEILELVSGFGYSGEALSAGCELYERALEAVNRQRLAAGTQQKATQALLEAQKVAADAYQALAKVARAVCDPSQLTALGLSGKTRRDTAGFLAGAYTLFTNAASLGSLSGFGYNAGKLTAERGKITTYDEANLRQEAAKGAAQQATREQEAALEALNQWTMQYLKIAKVALRENPQYLEKLGVIARTSKTASQRAARLKKEGGEE